MEIKILCACGTKFKFEVEPVHGRMPTPVNCPGCGADATAEANAIIQSDQGAAEARAQVDRVAAVPAGLRIARPAGAAITADAEEPPSATVSPFRARPLPPVPKPKGQAVKVLTTILTIALIGFGVWRFGAKWSKRLNFAARVAGVVGQASEDDGDSNGGPKNLWYEKCAMLFIQHTNHLEVAKACQEYWKTKQHKELLLIDSEGDYMNPGEYELIPAYNGYVRLIGAHEWPVPAHEGLAQHLSQNFGGLVFEWRSESFADTYHFGVYEQGARKFHAQMDVQIASDDAKEIYKTEGNEYVLAHGFKPGPEGFKNFHVLEADQVTQTLGMKLWDEKEGAEAKTMLLRENPPPARSN